VIRSEKISLIITSYNQKDLLVETLESALGQTFSPHEIIVADDCSTDGSVEMISVYARRYPSLVNPLFQERNRGVSINRSDGFQRATGDYITWANGDDRLLPRKLEMEIKTLRDHPGAKWVYSQVLYIDGSGERTGVVRYRGRFRKRPYTFKDVVCQIGREPAYQLMDRSVLEQVGLFDGTLEVFEDWDFAIRLAKNFRGTYCPIPLYEYRQHRGGLCSTEKTAHVRAVKRIFHNVLPLLKGMPEKEVNQILKTLRSEILSLKAASALETGQRWKAMAYTLRALKERPTQLFFYQMAMRSLLPGTVLDTLRIFKNRHLANLR